MASSLPSCIGNAFCSHRQASYFLLATLIPFFFPFFLLCVPFLILFLAPLSSLLFFLVLVYKVRASIQSRPHEKGATGCISTEASLVDKEGRSSQVLPESAEGLDAEIVQGLAVSEVGRMQSTVSDSIAKEPSDVDEHRDDLIEREQAETIFLEESSDVDEHDDARDDLEKEQAERIFLEEMTKNGQEGFFDSCGEPGENEESHVLASPSAESHIDHTKREQDFNMDQGMLLDKEQKPTEMREENVTGASFQDNVLTPWPSTQHSTQEHGSLQAISDEGPDYFHHSSSSILAEEQDDDSGEELPEVEPVNDHQSVPKFEEVSWKDAGDEIFEIDTPHTYLGTHHHQHGRQDDPVLSFEKQSGSTNVDFGLGTAEKYDLHSSAIEDVQEGEAICSSTDGFEPGRAEAFAKEQQDDGLPQQGKLDSHLQEPSEWDLPFKTSSAAAPSTQKPFEDVESQDKTQDKRKILADISAIKKIVGYQGEAHASAMEQIAALYLFLGMEPYDWDAGVDDLERARAEIELLKVVVGVK